MLLTEPELFRGYDPNKKVFNQEIELIHDLEPVEVAESEAQKFKLQHGDKCDIWAGEGGQWFAKLKRGACIFVPKAFSFSRTVAGQIPTGWDAGRYGIPEDIIAQTDRATLWALVCTADALNNSGITDPYELYEYIHPSEIGTSLGSGMGGVTSMAKMFKDRRDERDVQNDILQETYAYIYIHIFPLINASCAQFHQYYCRLGQSVVNVFQWSGQDSCWSMV